MGTWTHLEEPEDKREPYIVDGGSGQCQVSVDVAELNDELSEKKLGDLQNEYRSRDLSSCTGFRDARQLLSRSLLAVPWAALYVLIIRGGVWETRCLQTDVSSCSITTSVLATTDPRSGPAQPSYCFEHPQ